MEILKVVQALRNEVKALRSENKELRKSIYDVKDSLQFIAETVRDNNTDISLINEICDLFEDSFKKENK